MTISWSKSAWEEFRYDVDHRPILFEFSLPVLHGRFGFVGCDLNFWAISFILLSAECLLNCAFAHVIYHHIVPYQKSSRAYLVGYGLVLPIILLSPFVLLDWFPLSNMAFLLCLVGGTATLIMLRCVEAMHGTLPAFAQTSLLSFMMYYASALQFEIDETTGQAVPVTRSELMRKMMDFVSNFVRTSLLYSLLMPVGYKLFEAPLSASLGVWTVEGECPWWYTFFHWTNIANNFLMACLTSLVLECKSVMTNRPIIWHTTHDTLMFRLSFVLLKKKTTRNMFSGSCWSWYFNQPGIWIKCHRDLRQSLDSVRKSIRLLVATVEQSYTVWSASWCLSTTITKWYCITYRCSVRDIRNIGRVA